MLVGGFVVALIIHSIKNWSNNLRFASSYFVSEAIKVGFDTLATLSTLIFSIGF
ncbi:hypothetical protein ACJA23_00705 [Mycoplasma corogypsi]|uniref:hypothetical protein n=1 Tax=Mycoplasma corogypsi TaxID=2106 RepID=UPI0038732A0F